MSEHWDEEGYVRQRLNDAERRIEKMTVPLTETGLNDLSLSVAKLIEDEFVKPHVGGRAQRLAKVQIIVREALREAVSGERAWDSWHPRSCCAPPSKPETGGEKRC